MSRVSIALHSQPLTQNTAPVLEFSCLYTHDLRRKAKRWQDGHLRFHTFNKRVMVYDQSRNFVGDTHWQADAGGRATEVQEGDELTLEKSGVIVQVEESEGVVQTDLSGLLAKKGAHGPEQSGKKQATDRSANVGSSMMSSRPLALQTRTINTPARPLNAPMGRAIMPQKSPYEIRQAQLLNHDDDHWEQGPPSKRPRNDENHKDMWEVLRKSRPSRPRQANNTLAVTPQHNTMKSGAAGRNTSAHAAKQSRLKVTELVDLVSSSDAEIRMPTLVTEATRQPTEPHRRSRMSGAPAAMVSNRETPAISKEHTSRDGAAEFARHTDPLHQPPTTPAAVPSDMIATPSLRKAAKATVAATTSTKRKSKKDTAPATPNAATRANEAIRRSKATTTPLHCGPPSSPPVSVTNHLPRPASPILRNDSNLRRKTTTPPAQPVDPQAMPDESGIDISVESTRQKFPTKPLRIVAREPRKMLMCSTIAAPEPQPPPPRPQPDVDSDVVEVPKPRKKRAKTSKEDKPRSPSTVENSEVDTRTPIPESTPAFQTQELSSRSMPLPVKSPIAPRIPSVPAEEALPVQLDEATTEAPAENSRVSSEPSVTLPLPEGAPQPEPEAPAVNTGSSPHPPHEAMDAVLLPPAPAVPALLNETAESPRQAAVELPRVQRGLATSKPAPNPPPPAQPATAAKGIHRPFRRHHTAIVPVAAKVTSNAAAMPQPRAQNNGPLRRAETIALPVAALGSTKHLTATAGAASDEIGGIGADGVEKGPWTREAWDLLGMAYPGTGGSGWVYT